MNQATKAKRRAKAGTKRTAKKNQIKQFEDAPVALPWERRTRRSLEIDISDIFIAACQREKKPNSGKIEKHWEEARLDPPVVNIRKPLQGVTRLDKNGNVTNAYKWEAAQPPSAKYALTDGFQRITALKNLGFTKVRVETIEASVEYENWYFRHQDKFKARLSRKDMYSSLLSTDDESTLTIDSIVRRNGFYVPNKMTKSSKLDIPISSPTGPEDCYRYDNQGVVLDRTLKIIGNCWAGYDKAGHHDIIRGVGRLVKDYGGKITPEVEQTFRNRIQVGAMIEATDGGGSQSERAARIAKLLRQKSGIRKKAGWTY